MRTQQSRTSDIATWHRSCTHPHTRWQKTESYSVLEARKVGQSDFRMPVSEGSMQPCAKEMCGGYLQIQATGATVNR